MSETKHTPGPWWAGSDDDAHMVYSGDSGSVEAVADCGRDDGDYGAEEANARLIAAAPELLTACKATLARIEEFCVEEEVAMQAAAKILRTAIAKAEAK